MSESVAGTVRGTVFDIERYSTHDGPGIRTTVFLKGCYLRCAWCHNPESMSPKPESMYDASKCLLDLGCSVACPNDALHFLDENGEPIGRDRVAAYVGHSELVTGRTHDLDLCQHCGACVDVCYPKALEMVGRTMSVEEAFAEVVRDKAFYARSGGGVTASGGEPLYQADFVAALFAACQADGIHTALDTTAFRQWDVLEAVLRHTDLVLLDLKLMDSERHKAFTGVANEVILDNAERMGRTFASSGGAGERGPRGVWIRVPVIPTVNDDEQNQEQTIAFIKETMNGAVRAVELLGYHRLGGSKMVKLGKEDEAEVFGGLERGALEGMRERWEGELGGMGIEVRAR